jgi:hypothetical protein
MEERRRSLRRVVEGHSMAVHSAESVRILDLSASGVLLQAQARVGVHSKALLRLSVGRFAVRRGNRSDARRPAPQPSDGYRIAAQFLAITPKHRQLIERFISQ